MSWRRSAFTLVELLIVIAIIAIIVAMIIPALSRAREQARRAQCGSNLHQMALGMITYAASERGNLPRTNFESWGRLGSRTTIWQTMVAPTPIPPFPPTIEKVWGRRIWYCPSGPYSGGVQVYSTDVIAWDWFLPSRWGGEGDVRGNYGIQTDFNLWWGRAVDDAYFALDNGAFPPKSAREFAAWRVEQSGKLMASDMVMTSLGPAAVSYSNHMSKQDAFSRSDRPDGGNYVYMDASVRWYNTDKILENYYQWFLFIDPDFRWTVPKR